MQAETEKSARAVPKRYNAEIAPSYSQARVVGGTSVSQGGCGHLSIELVCETWLRGQRKIDVCPRVGLSAVLTASPCSQLETKVLALHGTAEQLRLA